MDRNSQQKSHKTNYALLLCSLTWYSFTMMLHCAIRTQQIRFVFFSANEKKNKNNRISFDDEQSVSVRSI